MEGLPYPTGMTIGTFQDNILSLFRTTVILKTKFVLLCFPVVVAWKVF